MLYKKNVFNIIKLLKVLLILLKEIKTSYMITFFMK